MSNDLEKTREVMKALGQGITEVLPEHGFVLLLFEFNKEGNVNYISNANRADMIAAMKEFIARAEGRAHDTPSTM